MESSEPTNVAHAYPFKDFIRRFLTATLMALTALLRLGLIALSVASFMPQYELMRDTNCRGLATGYVFANVVGATEQAALMMLITMAPEYKQGNVIRTPSKPHAWLNVVQCTATWLNHLVLFGLFIVYSDVQITHKLGLILSYTIFLSISIVPVAYTVYPPSFTGLTVRSQAQALLARIDRLHLSILGPGATALRVLTYGGQADQTRLFGAYTALGGEAEIGTQALVFAGVAVVGAGCLNMAPRAWKGYRPVGWNVANWYRSVGWAVVDGIVVAAIQGKLWVALPRRVVAQRLGLPADEGSDEWDEWEDWL